MTRALHATIRPFAVAALTFALALGGVAVAGAGTNEMDEGAAPEVVREILVQTVPSQAPDSDLYLLRVTVPPGAALAPHTHPGTQGAHIERGTLTYKLISGSATVVRAERDGAPAKTDTVMAPTTVKLRRGDVVIENPDLVHEAANEGRKPVVILLTSLLTKGAPLSEPAG